jgi:hypothetical protein
VDHVGKSPDAPQTELLEQQHLVAVAAREPVRAVAEQQLERSLGGPVAQPLERRPHDRGAREALIARDELLVDEQAALGGELTQPGELTCDRPFLALALVVPVMAAVGSATGQAIATREASAGSWRSACSSPARAACCSPQVSVDGSYLGDVFLGLLIFGPGLGAGYVAGSIASLAGVAETEAGLASGLNNTSFQIGGAVGVAILSTVAVSEAEGTGPLAALTNGYQAAFTTAIAFAGVGLLTALLLLGRLRAPGPTAEPAPVPAD